MNITVEERMMYEVMRALYVSGIPVSFKGSMVLKACLSEAGLMADTRHTVDIDANWNSETYPTMDQIAESLQIALDSSGLRLSVRPYRTFPHIWPGRVVKCGRVLYNRGSDKVKFPMRGEPGSGEGGGSAEDPVTESPVR